MAAGALALHTTLPVPVYRPFFVGQPLEKVLNDFSEREDAAVDVLLEGGFDRRIDSPGLTPVPGISGT